MKKLIKAIFIAILIVVLFSCNNEEANIGLKEKVTNVYKAVPLELPENVAAVGSLVVEDDAIYVLCTQEMESIVYKLGFDGKIIDSTPIVNDEESMYITSYQRFNDGRYVVLYQFYDGTVSYTLKIYSESNELVSEIDATSKANQEVSNAYFSYMKTDAENNIYLGGNSYLLVLSETGDKIYDNNLGSAYINNFGVTKDNKIYVNYSDYTANGSAKMEIIDINEKTLIPISLPDKYNSYNYTLYIGPEYDFYIKDDEGLYGYNNSADELTLLANWINSDISNRNVNNLTIISPDCFIFTGYNQIKQRSQLSIMNRIPDDEVKEKYIIRMNSLGDMTTISMAAVQFNLENDEYRVVIEQLKQDNNTDYSEWRESILNNYVNGNIPDIVPIENDITFQKLMDQGAFVDLYELLDNDPDISRESLLNCVRSSYERNGKLYQLFTSFNIQTLTAKTKNIKDIATWDINGAIDFLESLPNGVNFTEYDSMDMMSNVFLTKGFDKFIDYDNATCDFDNDEFRRILNLLSQYGEMDYNLYTQMNESGEITQNFIDDKTIFSSTSLSSFSSYLQLKAKFNLEDITFMGFPSSNSSKTNNSIIVGTSYAISSKSLYKEGAWEFLKYLLRDEVQNVDLYSYSFPSTVNAFYERANIEMDYIYSFRSANSYSRMYYGHGEDDVDVIVNKSTDSMIITQEDVDFLFEFFNSDFSVFRYDTNLVNIIYEELMPFIEGTKSLEETVKIIQSRSLVYMNENYS